MKKVIILALVAVMLSSVIVLTSCSTEEEGSSEATESTTKAEDVYPGLDLENYGEGETKEESENDAVSGIGQEMIEESYEGNESVESIEIESPIMHNYEEGVVAEYKIKITLAGSDEILEVTTLGYYVTIEQEDGTFKTYFISFEEIGQAEDMPEETIERLLQEEIDRIKEEESNNDKEDNESTDDEKEDTTKAPTEANTEKETEKATDKPEESTTPEEDDSEDGVDPVQDITDDDIDF